MNSEFTPVPDPIVSEIDREAGMVFGAVWRFCQGDFGECFATVETIAARAGMGTTATRKRLRALAAAGWITEARRKGETTIYRDAGRWRLRVIGATEPQRETLHTPTRDVALPQRETLPKKRDLRNKQESPQTASGGDAPTANDSDPWLPLRIVVARVGTNKPEPRIATKGGKPYGWIGEIIGDVGGMVGNNPGAAEAVWEVFEAGLTPEDRAKYINPGNLARRFRGWAANGGGPKIDAIRSYYAGQA